MALPQTSRTLPVALRRWLEFHAGRKCEGCGRMVDGVQLRRHWDHIYARRLGGEDVAFNLQLLCHQCNLRKWAHLAPQARAAASARRRQPSPAAPAMAARPEATRIIEPGSGAAAATIATSWSQ